MALYDFTKGHTAQWFRDKGIKPNPTTEDPRIQIVGKDLASLIDAGKITINNNECYINGIDEKKYPIFFYKKKFSFTNGNPKFHIVKCRAMNEYRGYVPAYKAEVPVIHNRTKEERMLVLELCGYCRQNVANGNQTTEEFFEEQQKRFTDNNAVIKLDLDGYTLDWSTVSRMYRESKKYTCEKCEIDLNDHRKYCHTHHIDRNKINNQTSNLQCLCIRCHSEVDEHHKANFKKRSLRRQLDEFRDKFPLNEKPPT